MASSFSLNEPNTQKIKEIIEPFVVSGQLCRKGKDGHQTAKVKSRRQLLSSLRPFGFSEAVSGRHRCVFLNHSLPLALKVPLTEQERRINLVEAAISPARIELARKQNIDVAMLFPKTHCIYSGLFLYQELCMPDEERYKKAANEIREVGFALGLVDLGSENTGWRNNKPVFIDLADEASVVAFPNDSYSIEPRHLRQSLEALWRRLS